MFQPLEKRAQWRCYSEGRDKLGKATFTIKESLTRLTIAERRVQAGLHTPVRRRRHRGQATQDLLGHSATTSEPLQAQLERTLSDHCRRESLEATDTQSPGAKVPRTTPWNMNAANLSVEDETLLREVSAWRVGGEELEKLKNAVASMRSLSKSSPLSLRPGLRQLSASKSKSRAETWSFHGGLCHDQWTNTKPRTLRRPGSAPAGGRKMHQFASSDPVPCRTASRRATKTRTREGAVVARRRTPSNTPLERTASKGASPFRRASARFAGDSGC